MRFTDDTKIEDLADALEPIMDRLLERDELTSGQECFGATIDFALAHPESQTTADLLAWCHGSTPASCLEQARAEKIEDWVAEEDMAAFEAFAASVE